MKTTIACLLFLFLLVAGNAYAGERAGAFSVSPFVGGYSFDDEQERSYDLRQHRMQYGVRAGYDLSDHLATEAVFSYVPGKSFSTGRDIDVFGYRLDFLYHFMPRQALVPYLAAGGGGMSFMIPGNHATDGVVNAGAGVKYFLTDSIAARFDGRWLHDFSYRALNNWEYSFGLSFLFGGRGAGPAQGSAATERGAGGSTDESGTGKSGGESATHHKYCVTLDIEFDIDRALVRPEYHDEVARVGEFMKRYPSATAVIEGHTDNVGNRQHNLELSRARAEAVVQYLVDHFSIERSRLSAQGYGPDRPLAGNATDQGKQKNRRIEAIVDCAFDISQVTPPDRLCVSLVIEFASGSSAIDPRYRAEIAKVADYLKRYPTTTAVVEGHTDNVGDEEANLRLSKERAQHVVAYLVQEFGIDQSRLSAVGYGSMRRIAYDDTPQGRQANRRTNAVIDCVIKK